MTIHDYLLIQAMSESNELAHRISKAAHFGLEEIQPGQPLTNRQRIMEEFHDLCGVLNMLGLFDVDTPAMEQKRLKVEHYIKYAESVGRVDPRRRMMYKIGVEGDRFNLHVESPECRTAGCIAKE